jgi:hypothetical protein
MTGSPGAYLDLLAENEARAGRIDQGNRGIAWADGAEPDRDAMDARPDPRADLGGGFPPSAPLPEPEAGQ